MEHSLNKEKSFKVWRNAEKNTPPAISKATDLNLNKMVFIYFAISYA